ncbi:protein translocase subunit SecF [Plantactinospora sp. KBS50]|uniref:protein translocase subunit SecF n=1 Tax=Plantactinospora sp. KBS50 TaxID=2024580 RepID=UPI000BAADD38|nr:protein translocase subunit SecF [Plantactinospora sp. KBS50]ASW54656.1 protein translocase subunit SecF [Plantactinospora sp. KBS50]
MARSGLATRLYRGEAGLNIVGRRKLWFGVAGAVVLVAILSMTLLRGFSLGIEFSGGNSFQIPATIGTLEQAERGVGEALSGDERLVSTQRIGGAGTNATYEVRTSELSLERATEVQNALSQRFNIPAEQISANRVSAAWGGQVTERALLGLLIFLAVVTGYLILRFEWRMAVAAVSSLLFNLVVTAGIYSLVGFEVTPSTVIGFLTILGFALYDVVVVFDKIQENTRSITGSSVQTYGEAANLAVNQTLMRSINTGLVALLPVGGLLFIGAFLLGAGTLKDLGLVLFVGQGIAVCSSIFFATPVLVTLKDFEPRIQAHTKRVLARRAGGPEATRSGRRPAKAAEGARAATPTPDTGSDGEADTERAALAGAAPRVGARPTGGKRSGGSRNRPGGGNRPSGSKRR